MISVLLETGHSRPSAAGVIAVSTVIAYALGASVLAGAASPGAGLGVLALGLFAATVADFALWRELALREPETVEAVANEEVPALAPPSPKVTIVDTPAAVPA